MLRGPTGVSVDFWENRAFCIVGVYKILWPSKLCVRVCSVQGLRVKESLPVSELVVSEVNIRGCRLDLGRRELPRQS